MQNIKDIRVMTKFGILFGSLFISLFFSCKKVSNNKLLSFELSSSGCFKTCPILDAKLTENIIYFNLIKFNRNKGIYKYRLTKKDIDSLNDLMNSVSLDSLKEKYASYIPDKQNYNTKLVYNGKEKKVFFFENEAPKEYSNLVNYIISLKEKESTKIDTVLNVTTRKGMEIIDASIPPIPNNKKE